jgi:hypothetical protein
MANVDLVKEIYGINTYTKAVDTSFTELISTAPVSGSINSHVYLVERSQQYIGGSVIDNEKQALIEEINSLRQQLLDLNQSFTNINDLV